MNVKNRSYSKTNHSTQDLSHLCKCLQKIYQYIKAMLKLHKQNVTFVKKKKEKRNTAYWVILEQKRSVPSLHGISVENVLQPQTSLFAFEQASLDERG